MSHLPTHERLKRIELMLKDHEARLEEVEEETELKDTTSEPLNAVYVREDISVSDGFEDVRQWVPEEEEDQLTEHNKFRPVTSIGDIELYHNDDVGYFITNEKVRRGNAEGVAVEKSTLITLAEVIGHEQTVREE